ncbi:TraB/GumN family protein [Sphingomonas sp. LHG3406-1]|uniref:TraB/GumN family protein n=1 Tax=Sphingomonas sp. LHG3406-1 TaxID=2804617 RepID=UPI0026039282|nr:TraB/GumN family protein [Sphingomonas sp. LHG3406-1]
MRKTIRTALLAATFLLSPPALAQAQSAASAPASAAAKLPDTDPALWVVKDADTTIYLFGTFHALDGKTDWFNDEVKAAFDRSSKVYFEILKPEDSAVAPLVQKYWVATDGKPLSSKLSDKGRKDLADALADLGAPPTALESLKPFAASMALAALGAQKVGKTGEQGAEAVITAAAKQAGKPVDQLETLEFQFQLFDNLSEAEQIRMLEYSAATIKDMDALFARMTKAWNDGDADGLAAMMNEMQTQSPAMHDLLLISRNKTWASWIENRLKEPGTVFIAVGAGHLAGKDSVQDILAQRKVASQRIKY